MLPMVRWASCPQFLCFPGDGVHNGDSWTQTWVGQGRACSRLLSLYWAPCSYPLPFHVPLLCDAFSCMFSRFGGWTRASKNGGIPSVFGSIGSTLYEGRPSFGYIIQRRSMKTGNNRVHAFSRRGPPDAKQQGPLFDLYGSPQ